MRIAIVGAGAIGGMLTAILYNAGHRPTLIARGRTLENLRTHGLTFIEKGTTTHSKVEATDDPATIGPQDLVIIATKAHQIEPALPNILPLIGPNSTVLPAINGIPWWFFQGWGGTHANQVLEPVDPNGVLYRTFAPDQVLGCAVYLAANVDDPCTITSVGPRKLILGGVTKDAAIPVETIAELLKQAGINAIPTPDIRAEVMNKLMGNLWANPLSVVTRATMTELCDDPGLMDISRGMMREFEDLCGALNIELPISIEKRLQGAASLGDFRTSMLQDADRGRAIELEAILGGVIAAANKVQVPCPTMQTVYALVHAHARSHGLLAN